MHSSDVRRKFIQTAFAVVITIAVIAYFWFPVLWSIVIIGPVILCGIYDIIQKKHTLMRNYPVIGRGRWMAEMLRPPIQQYFVENEVDGAPINRMFRSVVYQRAKKVLDSVPFGTQADVYRVGYEWLGHSLTAIAEANSKINVRFKVGGPRCTIPYTASILNISAMSYGSLGSNAILALNGGAKLGNFAHNTGEGGISKYHLANDGDLVWQVGTGYFGCRTKDGKFCADSFKENATKESVRMIEIKLSQGAKPGHGGILPAVKNTPEIAEIRHVEPFTRVDSPPAHSSFDSPLGLMKFIQQLRELSG
ncbi:MAG: FMN-binding glutamate synthase family protein, partial [Candidatus Obscuribacterales bacterium]|nr:FMN-binding glutamate synthase family protein [Candidatus Obscuribacterales bacterium]